MKKIKYLFYSLLVCTLLVLVSCKKEEATTQPVVTTIDTLDKLSNCIKESIPKSYQVVTTTSIKDGQTEVYRKVVSISLNNQDTLSAEISIDTYTLNSSFQLEKSTTVEKVSNIDSNQVFGYDLNANYFTTYTVTEDGLSSTVKASFAGSLLNSSTVKATNDFDFNIILNNRKITNLDYSYSMDNKAVTVTSEYSYINI